MPNFLTFRNAELLLAWTVIVGAIVLAMLCGSYTARHFAVATDVRQLFPANLPWTERNNSFMQEFPQYDMLAVVDAPTPEFADRASTELADDLRANGDHIQSVVEPQGNAFFKRNAFLYLPLSQLERTSAGLQRAGPLIGALASDPSLVGALHALSGTLMGVRRGQYQLNDLAPTMNAAADTVENALADRPAHFSWLGLADPKQAGEQRRFIEIAPALDFNALQPAESATDAVTISAQDLLLAQKDQAQVRLTGLAPMNDAQFSTLEENAALNIGVSILAVLIILWFALRSWQIVVAAIISVTCGLCYTAALGLALVGSLNLISVAFFVLFVGLAVDFAIQFSVRYREERHESHDLRRAIVMAGRKAGWPLALAAAATALGFSAFLPTNYRGLSELGLIAGPGMIIAFLTSITLLPALLMILAPPGEPETMGLSFLAPVDRFLQRRRIPVLVATLTVVLLASPLLAFLKFDFNTLHMQNPKAEPVETFLSIKKDPSSGANAVEIVAPDLDAARSDVARLSTLPAVAGVRTIDDLLPKDQDSKLRIISGLAAALGPSLARMGPRSAHSDAETVTALDSTARDLATFDRDQSQGGKAATRLSTALEKLASADPNMRRKVETAIVDPLEISLSDLRLALRPQRTSIGAIPEDLRRMWLAPDGRACVQVLPKGETDDTAKLRSFVSTILAQQPNATGPAVTLYKAGTTVVRSFIEAGAFALVAIALLLWVALRKLRDVAMTLLPLLLAAVLTLELCVVLNIPLNFTNIIAFPLLLGVGVAFKIYYIMAWRRGRTALVQSTLTRAVLFSALTTATAFGSLWLSQHPGTSSMGKLMFLSLICTMLAAVFFQPLLMGPPRTREPAE